MPKSLVDVAKGAYKLALQIVKQSADAQDILQDAMAVAISHKDAPHHEHQDFKPWFYRVVRNKSIDRFREISRHPVTTGEIDTFNSNENCVSGPEFQLQNEQLKQKIKKALNQLSAQQRDLILLKDSHNMSYADISKIIGIPQGTVMSSLHRARIALKNNLNIKEEN